MTLTVVDGFEGGETNSTQILVLVSQAPEILTTNPVSSDYVNIGDPIFLNYSVFDQDLEDGLVAWMDIDSSVDSDGDGILQTTMTGHYQETLLSGGIWMPV